MFGKGIEKILFNNIYHFVFWKRLINQSLISFIIFSDFPMLYQIFPLPQVKRWAIITYNHGTHKFPHKLLNDLRLRVLEN